MFVKSDTQTMVFQEAARLNAHGVHYLRYNNRETAHRHFTQAFRMLTELLMSSENAMTDHQDNTSCNAPSTIRTVPFHAEANRQHACFYTFTRALIFQPSATNTRPSKFDMTLSIMVTLFNTALIYHLQGGSYCLMKASTLYQHILLIVQESCPSDFADSEGDQERNLFHTLAVLAINNGIHVSILSKNIIQAYNGLEDLDTYMNHDIDGQDGGRSTSPSLAAVLGENVAEELHMNLLVPGISIAAEAA